MQKVGPYSVCSFHNENIWHRLIPSFNVIVTDDKQWKILEPFMSHHSLTQINMGRDYYSYRHAHVTFLTNKGAIIFKVRAVDKAYDVYRHEKKLHRNFLEGADCAIMGLDVPEYERMIDTALRMNLISKERPFAEIPTVVATHQDDEFEKSRDGKRFKSMARKMALQHCNLIGDKRGMNNYELPFLILAQQLIGHGDALVFL